MKQQEVFKKIGGIIKELNDQYEFLQSVQGPLNELELELFVANSHFLTDHIVILNKLNAQNKPVQKPAEKEVAVEISPAAKSGKLHEEKHFEPMVRPVAPIKYAPPVEKPQAELFNNVQDNPVPQIDLETNSREDTYSFIREEQEPEETIRHELILDESENWEDEEEKEDAVAEDVTGEEIEIPPVPETPVFKAKKEETQPVVETYTAPPVKEAIKENIPTINEKISAQRTEKSRAAEHHAQPISDLKSAINLNDKLLYIKELFNGYNLAYSEAIDILNRFSSFDEAELFLKKNYVAKNNWDDKLATTEKFYTILKRRYA